MDRSILLPDFMQTPTWIAYAKAIDTLMRDTDHKTRLLSRIREPFHLSYTAQQKVLTSQMISATSDLDTLDREYLVRSLNLVGLPFNDTSLFTEEHLFRFLRSLAQFWYSKGKASVADFLSYVLNADLRIVNMWTTDYVTFYPEGDPEVGASVTVGGAWYPTTHFQLTYDPSILLGVSIRDVINMVYDIGNYNLVLHSVVAEMSLPVVQDSDNVTSLSEFTTSRSLAVGAVVINEITIPTV